MIECKSIYGNRVHIPAEKLVFRPSVYGIVLHEGRLLLLRGRSNGRLHFPGGGVDMAERLPDALRREMREETGLEVEIGAFFHFIEDFFYYDPKDSAFHTFCFFYRCRPLTFDLLDDADVDDDESEQPRWYAVSDLRAEDFEFMSAEVFTRLLDGPGMG